MTAAFNLPLALVVMPLPENTLSLGPHTNPGESEHSKPKVAMLVRMSTETLDALQALGEKPPIDVEFGDLPVSRSHSSALPAADHTRASILEMSFMRCGH